MLVHIKIVPDNEPNAGGEWIEKDVPPFESFRTSWIAAAEWLAPYVPSGFHCVGYGRKP